MHGDTAETKKHKIFGSIQPEIDWILTLTAVINTAKLSSLLLPRTLSFAPKTNSAPPPRSPVDPKMSDGKKGRRRRSSSLLIYQEPLESPEHMSDQSALPNLNANWVNAKGIYLCPTGEHLTWHVSVAITLRGERSSSC